MPRAYAGRFLKVDLTSGSISTPVVEESLIRRYIGGKGFGARLLFEMVDEEVDALDPRSVILFMPGPLTGTMAPSMREVIVFKSPLTGTYGDSYHGGYFGPEIKYAGYDGIIISGRAGSPVYLHIDDDRVELRDAGGLWGLDTYATNERLLAELGDPSYKIACIGPAGENLVRFALIDATPHRQAGRGGAGAVMGSKNLKAVAVRGTRPVSIADPQRFAGLLDRAYAEIRRSPGYTELGTMSDMVGHSEMALYPVRNAQQASFAEAARIDGPMHRKRIWLRHTACMGCIMACSKVGALRRGPHAGTICDNVEYESAALLGTNLGIGHLEGLAYACHLCDVLGMDTMSAGGVIGFAMEAIEREDMPPIELDGQPLRFGNYRAVHRLLEMIARREGAGDLLAEGVRRAAERVGGESHRYAIHTKGLEMPGYDPRGLPGFGLGYMTGDKGGEHVQGYMATWEAYGVPWKGKLVDRFAIEGKAEILINHQDYQAGTNALVKCDFVKGSSDGERAGPTPNTFAGLLSAATGIEFSAADILTAGARINSLTRLFNMREGFTRRDDALPPRMLQDPLPDPPVRGRVLRQEELDYMLDDYYRLRGWDANGMPTAETLRELELEEEGRALGIG